MDLLCLDSRKLGGRGTLLDRVWKCQNWPMNVSKDKHRKAKRKCLNPAATERSVPGEQTPGTNLRLSHINVFLTSVRQHVPLKIHRGLPKYFFWRRCLFPRQMSAKILVQMPVGAMHERQICKPSWLIAAVATEHVSDTCAVRRTSRAEEFLHPRFHSETKK